MYLVCGGIFKYDCCKFTTESVCENFFFENRLIFGEVIGKSLVSCFFDSQCSTFALAIKWAYYLAISAFSMNSQLLRLLL